MAPDLGRFHGADPWPGNVGDPISLHRYLYAAANPVSNVDPTGLFSTSDVLVAMSAAVQLSSRIQPLLAGVYVRTMGALLVVPGAVPVLTTWGTRIAFGAGVLGMAGMGLESIDG